MPCPMVFSQVSWLLTTPYAAHGLVSKDADNVYKMGRTLSQSGLLKRGDSSRFSPTRIASSGGKYVGTIPVDSHDDFPYPCYANR